MNMDSLTEGTEQGDWGLSLEGYSGVEVAWGQEGRRGWHHKQEQPVKEGVGGKLESHI